MKSTSKYHSLYIYLSQQEQRELTLSFADIEHIIGTALTPTARTNKGWWSNRKKHALQADSWQHAGYVVANLDIERELVTFHRKNLTEPLTIENNIVKWDNIAIKALRAHMGLTQAEFAQRLGIRQQTVSEWERGMYLPVGASLTLLNLVAQQSHFPQ